MNKGYIKSLDGLRAIAILLVMTFHAGLNHFGWMGVQLFFVLSGYLITGILLKEKQTAAPLSFKLKKFWVRRSLRIFPLYFGYLCVLGLSWLLVHFPNYYTTYAPYLFTYTFNYTRLLQGWQGNPLFTHLWSLSIEEQFYLFFPLLVFWLRPKALPWLLLLVIAVAPAVRQLLYAHFVKEVSPVVAADAVYWHTASHLDAFFTGGLLPLLSLPARVGKPARWLLVFFLLALTAGLINFFCTPGAVNFFADWGYNHDAPDNYAHVWRYTLLNLFFASLILALTGLPSRIGAGLNKIFENGWLVQIGRVSYGMYIFHWLIFVYGFARFSAGMNGWVKLALFIPYATFVYGVAAISFRFFESYFIRLKERFFRQ